MISQSCLMNFIFVQKDAAFNATFLVVKYSSKVQSTEIDCELKAIVKERRSTPVGYIQNALAEFLCGPYFRETGEKTDNVNFFSPLLLIIAFTSLAIKIRTDTWRN